MKYACEITTHFCSVAIGLLILALAATLITPQVDSPDALSNRIIKRVSGPRHAHGIVVLPVNGHTSLVRQPIDVAQHATFRRSPVSLPIGAHYVLIRPLFGFSGLNLSDPSVYFMLRCCGSRRRTAALSLSNARIRSDCKLGKEPHLGVKETKCDLPSLRKSVCGFSWEY
jgi:hypothetical protein